MNATKTINVAPTDDTYSEWTLVVPYSVPFNDEFKARVPSAERRWEPESKSWVVTDRWKDFVVALAVKYHPSAAVVVMDV